MVDSFVLSTIIYPLSTPMRLGLIIYGTLDTVSGGYLYDRQVVRELRQRGCTVEIIALPWRSYARHLADNWSPVLWQRLRALPVDLLLQDELNHPSLCWLNQRLRRQVQYPLVSIVHHLRTSEEHPAYWQPFYRWVERSYLRTLDGCIYNSRTTRSAVERLLGSALPGIVAYPAGNHLPIPAAEVVQQQINARCQQPGPLQILFIGNLIARKGLHTLLAALAALPTPDWRLTVIGSLTVDPAYVRQIRQQLAQSALGERVQLTGSLPTEELLRQLPRHHLLVVPSYEGYGIVYLEAMSYGLPVIASTAGAAHEIVTPGVDGFLVAPSDTQHLAQQIHHLQTNRAFLCTLSHNAGQRFTRQPTWQDSATLIFTWLQQQIA
jgi:glycosyltransferase involved in cell wall biosynthesis